MIGAATRRVGAGGRDDFGRYPSSGGRTRTIRTDHYVRTVRYDRRGLVHPNLSCWGLWRYAVEREAGPEALEGLDVYPNEGHLVGQMRGLIRGRADGAWGEVPPMSERPLDLVLMRALVGRGRTSRMVELHCGVVVGPGMLMDVEDENGVLVRCFRAVDGERPAPTLYGRVEGIYRWRGLC